MIKLQNIFVVIRRYDERYLNQYGFHFFDIDGDGYRYEEVPFLLNAEQTEYKVEDFTSHQGYTQIDLDWNDIPEWLERLIRQSCPIEFHSGLRDRNIDITSRIRVFGKNPVISEEADVVAHIREAIEKATIEQRELRESLAALEDNFGSLDKEKTMEVFPGMYEALQDVVEVARERVAVLDTQLLKAKEMLRERGL